MTEIPDKFKKRIAKLGEQYNIPLDLIDIESVYDSKISESENYEVFKDYISQMSVSSNGVEAKAESDLKSRNKTKKSEMEEIERIKIENLRQEKEEAEREFDNRIKSIENNSDVIEEIYKIPSRYVEAVVNQNNHIKSLLLMGNQGVGKSYGVLNTLNKLKADYVYKSGFITPLSLYMFLYEHGRDEDKTIVFDDTHGLINNQSAVSILLSALYSSSGEKEVSWDSTSTKLSQDDIPNRFIFKANLIFITNKLPNNLGADLINSRCLTYEFDFNNYEILEIMKAIAQTEHPDLSHEERNKVFDFIRQRVDESTEGFDLRVQQKVENLYLFDRENWKELAKPLLKNKNEELLLVKKLIEECSNMKEAENKFNKETGGRHRSTFYRHKKKLMNRL